MADQSMEEMAVKAQAMAEKCFLAGNLKSARQWMQSATRLAPGLPGVAQAAAAYDVHAAAARTPPDWYAVLGLQNPRHPPPLSSNSGAPAVAVAAAALTLDDIKKQHRKLCLLVHPDKNPSAAADGAFKLIQAAWEALSITHHPPSTATAATPPPEPAGPPATRPPDPPPRARPPPPRPQNQPPPKPQQKRRTPRTPPQPQPQHGPGPSCYHKDVSPPRTPRVPPSQGCTYCGASTPSGKRNQRCMVCHQSPIDSYCFDDRYYDIDGYY